MGELREGQQPEEPQSGAGGEGAKDREGKQLRQAVSAPSVGSSARGAPPDAPFSAELRSKFTERGGLSRRLVSFAVNATETLWRADDSPGDRFHESAAAAAASSEGLAEEESGSRFEAIEKTSSSSPPDDENGCGANSGSRSSGPQTAEDDRGSILEPSSEHLGTAAAVSSSRSNCALLPSLSTPVPVSDKKSIGDCGVAATTQRAESPPVKLPPIASGGGARGSSSGPSSRKNTMVRSRRRRIRRFRRRFRPLLLSVPLNKINYCNKHDN